MANESNDLLRLLNGSGFPFQIGVRKEIERTASEHGWVVDAEEHHWHHPATNSTGFIDLVISHCQYIYTILIECKRVKEDGKWLFLTPSDYTGEKHRITVLCSNMSDSEDQAFFGWSDFDFNPVSPEAAYCVYHNQDERNPLLERVADDVLPAAEAVAVEEMKLKLAEGAAFGDWRLFLPMIVTNATLYTGTFDAEKVSMANGRIDEGICKFTSVPFIRFRKSLATHFPRKDTYHSNRSPLARASLLKERTILVVNSAALAESLKILTTAGPRDREFGIKLHNLNR
jgi:hypothetical protein